jgi:GT2 family glycosyltransferase
MRPIARITVAVAACDRPHPLVRCLEAIIRGSTLPAQLVVVDQSRDGAVEAEVRGLVVPNVAVQYIRQPRLGLSASRNAALAAATQPAIAFTDDDCVPDREWLAAVAAALAAPGAPAAVAGRVLPLGEPSAGRYVVSPRGDDQATDHRAGAVPWTVGTGGNFVARRAWLERIGGFDEDFFLYAEETDWQRRLVDAGRSVVVVDAVQAIHAGAGTSADPRRRESLFHAGTETYVRKWHGRAGWASYRAAALVGALLRSLSPGERGSAARRRAYLYVRGPRRVVGGDT